MHVFFHIKFERQGQYKEDVYVNSWKECLNNCDGQQFHQYQKNQQPPFTSTHWTYKMTTTYDVGNQGSWLKENENNFWFVVLQNLELIKKNENMTFFIMKILQGLTLKHVYILLILNFPQNMQAAIFPLSVTSLHPFPFTCSTVSKQ